MEIAKQYLLVSFCIAATICYATWKVSSYKNQVGHKIGTVRVIPYWIPFVGHAMRLAFQPNALLRGARDASVQGIFAIVLGGATHNMVFDPSLAQSIFSQRSDTIDFEAITWWILEKVGGIPRKWKPNFEAASEQLNMAVKSNLLREPELARITQVTMRNIEANAPHMISFARSRLDQHAWEKNANISVLKPIGGCNEVEADLLPLIIDFIGQQALPSIFGMDFVRNNTQILNDLWVFNFGFLYLAADLPRWLPIPILSRAYAARDRICRAITELQHELDALVEGMDVGENWGDLQDVSPLLRQRHLAYREHGIPPEVRAPGDLAILWAQNANSNFAIFWMLMRIFCQAGLVAQLREEVAPFVHVNDAASAFVEGSSAAPLKINDKALVTSCPLLKACFIESMRLDSAPWSVRTALKDFSITSEATSSESNSRSSSILFEKGSYVDIPFDLHFTDPRHFPEPTLFKPERHLHAAPDSTNPENHNSKQKHKTFADWGTVRPFGGGKSMCKGRLFAEREVLSCVAALLTLWDFKPANDDRAWKIPKHGKATGVSMPKDNIRVRIRKRT